MDCTITDVIEQFEIDALRYEFKVNGEIAEPELKLSGGETIECVPKYVPPAEPEPQKEEGILDFNRVVQTLNQVVEADNSLLVTVNGKKLVLPPKATNYLFIDLFNHIDFDLTNPRGVIQLKINGRDANYTDIIKTGDVIDIYWRE